VDEVANYFVEVETEYMGLTSGNPAAVRNRAGEVTHALCKYVTELRT
jgi:hypothetical protein